MIVVSGQPRSGTSMMVRCVNMAGIPLAFKHDYDRPNKDSFRNIHGFFEGLWDGKTDGVLKCLSPNIIKSFPNPRVIFMKRKGEGILSSWKDVVEAQRAKGIPMKIDFSMKPEDRYPILLKILEGVPLIEVDYDEFVQTPDIYKQKFKDLFPEIDFEKLKSGIDRELYKQR